jgi:hypothetical protein
MSERQSAPSVHEFRREDSDPAFVADLQQSASLANENCDRALALAHKLSAQVREAQHRINQLELEADGLVDRLRAQAETAVAKVHSNADARVDRTQREADQRIALLEAATENRVGRLQDELTQAKLRADRAEQWLVRIRRQIEDHLMPSFTAMRDPLSHDK